MSEAPGRWLELSVVADGESVEAVADLFSRYGYNQGVVVEEPYRQDADGENFQLDPLRPVVVRTFLPGGELSAPGRQAIEEGLWHLRQIGQVGELTTESREEEDWANAWKEHFPVLRIGGRFVVKPSWREYGPGPDDLVIHLDPGMAFGTGSHPSTELCLQFMENIPFAGERVLDAGAGSGILTIGALLRSAESVHAVEIDPVAASALRSNLARNTGQERVTVTVSGIGSALAPHDTYDVVLANLIARILVDEVAALAGAVESGGLLLASGIFVEREPEVVAAYRARRFSVVERQQSGDWVALLMRAPER
jgi:ribosomal protein L11 methyltransferase